MGAQQAAGPQPGATPRGRGDAFDPSQSTAPGPRVLGQIDGRGVALPGGPLGGVIDEGDDPAAPMDLLNPRRPRASAPLPAEPPRTQAGLQPQPQTPGVDGAPSSIPPPGPRTDFEAAVAALRNSQLDVAETGFKDFLQRYPQSQLVASATFNLGDVYARRGRHREAAEQFLKVSTDYSKASQAPMSLLKLGESLERLGAKEQACAAWGEIGRKYPGASAAVKAGVERDMKRVQC
jgi:tol-pal system protein YbgF